MEIRLLKKDYIKKEGFYKDFLEDKIMEKEEYFSDKIIHIKEDPDFPIYMGKGGEEERGRLFIGAGTPVYEGMIVGANPKTEDLVVNVCKKKHMTNTRASGSDDALKLTPPTVMSLEQSLEFITDDELVEVTPKNIRLRKIYLTKEQRIKAMNRK